jgi:hypothetical protein
MELNVKLLTAIFSKYIIAVIHVHVTKFVVTKFSACSVYKCCRHPANTFRNNMDHISIYMSEQVLTIANPGAFFNYSCL